MPAAPPVTDAPLWLELPPIAGGTPQRLIVFLHGAGSGPEALAPAAVAFMLKFPSARGAIMQGLEPGASGSGFDWYGPGDSTAQTISRIQAGGDRLAARVSALQAACGIDGHRTIIVGFAQGATLALELARHHPERLATVVALSGRMLPPPGANDTITATIHLVHGLLDTVVPVAYARQAFGRLRGAGVRVTLDLIEDLGHSISQEVIILGTTRIMQTLFAGRRPGHRPSRILH
jgi:phospholipase/carboxylesterase